MSKEPLGEIIRVLSDNGDYDCQDCGHKAKEIEAVVKVAEAALALYPFDFKFSNPRHEALWSAVYNLKGKDEN